MPDGRQVICTVKPSVPHLEPETLQLSPAIVTSAQFVEGTHAQMVPAVSQVPSTDAVVLRTGGTASCSDTRPLVSTPRAQGALTAEKAADVDLELNLESN